MSNSDFSILQLDATAQAALIKKGEITPLALTNLAISAIERLNPEINALSRPMFEEARAAAKADIPDGPFRGVPFLLKDGLATYKGIPTGSGSQILAELPAKEDSELVRRYKQAGFIILGKTNMPEFGLLPATESQTHGACRNPWDTSKTPGGSSGGSAAMVAARGVAAAHGNDGGGSIRIPASCCGLFGLKPSRGRLPLGPQFTELVSGLVAEHVLTRSVRDSAAILDATMGPDVGDPYWAPPQDRAYAELITSAPRKLKIGYSFRTPYGREVHADCVTAAQESVHLLRSLGHELIEVSLPQVFEGKRIGQMFGILWAAGATTAISAIKQATGKLPPRASVEPLSWALYEMGQKVSAADYEIARLSLQRVARQTAYLFEEIDIWLSPSLGEPPVSIGTFAQNPDNPMAPFLRASVFAPFTAIFNVTGQPAASVPLHWNEEGLPIGTQIVGKYGDEATVFQLAAQMEQAQPWIDRMPVVSV